MGEGLEVLCVSSLVKKSFWDGGLSSFSVSAKCVGVPGFWGGVCGTWEPPGAWGQTVLGLGGPAWECSGNSALLGMLVELHLLSCSGIAPGGELGFGVLLVEHSQLGLDFPPVRTSL